MNREILWKKHELTQLQLKEIEKWYEKWGTAIMELEENRQKIVKRYFEFENGEIKTNAQKRYVLIRGKNIRDYDREMGMLMNQEQTSNI